MKHGLSEEYATITADHLVDAELRGTVSRASHDCPAYR
jgi:LDH2 family malate/lactate/ureidoglycolate dehydrogenase